MDTPRTVLLVFLLIFIFLSPDPQQPTPSQQRELHHLLAEEQHGLDVLRTTNYGDFDPSGGKWLNLTGARLSDGYGWEVLSKVKSRAREQIHGVLGEVGIGRLEGNTRSSEVVEAPSQASQNPVTLPPIPLYQNVTGLLHGHWARSRLSDGLAAPRINLTNLTGAAGNFATNEYDRNITGLDGKVQLRLDEKLSERLSWENGEAREIKAQLTIKDETSSGDGWDVPLRGIHYPDSGNIVLTTSGEKLAGLAFLPQLALSEHQYLLARELLNSTITKAVQEHEKVLQTGLFNPWAADSSVDFLFPSPHCEFIIYLQQHPLALSGSEGQDASFKTSNVIKMLEDELRFPTGAPVPGAPPLTMSMVIFSPDCGFILESKGPRDFSPQEGLHLQGPKLEAYMHVAKHYTLAMALVVGSQVLLLMRQMKDASTPSTRSRISFYTIAMMSMGDGFVCMGFLTVGMFLEAVFLPLVTVAFLGFFCVSFFGMKFLMDIWTVQAPERRERERQRRAALVEAMRTQNTSPNVPGVVITPAGADTLPLPATARRPEDSGNPVILPPDQDIGATQVEDNTPDQTGTENTAANTRREFGILYSRFYFLLLIIIFISLHATSWPTPLRSAYTNILALVYLSFWIPQIYRNIVRNCRKALRWEFVVGQSIVRLAPFVYFYTVPNNVLFIEIDRHAALVLIGWVWMQLCVLVSQELLGPRFFIPDGWAPPAYDYHPILREDDLEAGGTMPVLGFTQATEDNVDRPSGEAASPTATRSAGESRDKSKRTFDCAICMQNIEVPILPSAVQGVTSDTATLASSILARRAYMVTPCRHIFHSACLEGWMKYRLACPICRETLPPL